MSSLRTSKSMKYGRESQPFSRQASEGWELHTSYVPLHTLYVPVCHLGAEVQNRRTGNHDTQVNETASQCRCFHIKTKFSKAKTPKCSAACVSLWLSVASFVQLWLYSTNCFPPMPKSQTRQSAEEDQPTVQALKFLLLSISAAL